MRNRSTRTLNDLYVRGTPVLITSPADSVVIWMQKLDPVDHDRCVRKARAARARARATYQDHDSEEYLALVDAAWEAQREDLVQLIIAPEKSKLAQSIRAEMELSEDSEWAKDDYLAGLYQDWTNTLEQRYVEDPDDPEALRVLAELRRFQDEFDAALTPRAQELTEQFGSLPDDAVREKAIEAIVEQRLQEAWFEEFVRSEIWLASRQPCDLCHSELEEQVRRRDAGEPPIAEDNRHQTSHPKYYFADRDAVDRLHEKIREHLEATYLELSVDPIEGKGLPGNGASSGSSEESAPEGIAPSSGPVAAPA